MTNKNIFMSFGGLDPELIMKAAPAEKVQKKKKNGWVKWVSIAACFALIIGTVLLLPTFRDDGPDAEPSAKSTSQVFTPGNVRPLHWGDVSALLSDSNGTTTEDALLVQRSFYEVIEGKYSTYKSGNVIAEDRIASKIDTVKVRTGWLWVNENKETDVYEVEAEVYEIQGVPRDTAVAIRYLEEPIAGTTEHYYVYANKYCSFDTLSAFFDSYNAKEYLSVKTGAFIREKNEKEITTYIYKISEGSLDVIKNELLALTSTDVLGEYTSDSMARIESIASESKQKMQLTLFVESAGGICTATVLDNGYLYFNGFGETFNLYNIGKEGAQKLFDSLIINAELISPSTSDTIVTTSVKK